MDIYKTGPDRVHAKLYKIFDTYDEPHLEHDVLHYVILPYLVSEDVDAWRHAMIENDIVYRTNQVVPGTFLDLPVRVMPTESEIEDVRFAENPSFSTKVVNYKPVRRFKTLFARLLKDIGVVLPRKEYKTVVAIYGYIVNSQTSRGMRSNLLNVYYVIYKLVEQFVTGKNRNEILISIRLPSPKRLVEWDGIWSVILSDLPCIKYIPTIVERQIDMVPFDVDTDVL